MIASVSAPTTSIVLTRVTSFCETETPVVTDSLKPVRLTVTVKVPGGTVAKVASPEAPLVPWRVQFVSVCSSVTSAPGTAAPESSRTSTTTVP